MAETYGIQIIGKGDQPIMIDHRGLLQTWVDSVVENIGSTSPIVIKFYIPLTVLYVRQLRLSLRFEQFRAYDKSALNFGTILTTKTPSTSHSHNFSFNIQANNTGTMSGTATETKYTGSATYGGVSHIHTYQDSYRYNYAHSHSVSGTTTMTSTQAHYHESNPHSHPMEQGIFISSNIPSGVKVSLNGNQLADTFDDTTEDIELPVGQLVYGWNTFSISSTTLGRMSINYFIQTFVSV